MLPVMDLTNLVMHCVNSRPMGGTGTLAFTRPGHDKLLEDAVTTVLISRRG